MKTLTRVEQEYKTSCGIACVACITRRSHSSVMKTALHLKLWKKGTTSYYTNFYQIKKLLAEYGFRGGRPIRTKEWDKAQGIEVGIAAIHLRTGDDEKKYWHWVVFQNVGEAVIVLDPKKGLKRAYRTDYWQMKLHALLPLTRG